MREKSKFGWIRRFSILIKKVFIIVLLLLIGVLPFAGCDKSKDDNGTTTKPQQDGYNIEYIYNSGLEFKRANNSEFMELSAFNDTVIAHAANQKVKTIHIIPQVEHMCGNSPESGMVARANDLDNLYNSSNGKLSGEGTTLYLTREALNNARVQEVFHNKLKANLLEYTY